MKRLLLLWDPENPVARVEPVLRALRGRVEVLEHTFTHRSHRTLPNGAFDLQPVIEHSKADALLWIEGGPFPKDLKGLAIRKACWLLNTHHEPTLARDLAPLFDIRLARERALSADEGFRWIPLASGDDTPPSPPSDFSILVDDPRPPSHVRMERAFREATAELPGPEVPIVLALGQGESVHPHFFEALRSRAAVVADPSTDLREILHVGEHAEIIPVGAVQDGGALHTYLRELVHDRDRLRRLSERGPEIVRHLHDPGLRARQILEAIWPTARILGGAHWNPSISILVTCHRYRKRLAVCLESLARQALGEGSLEIVVADPESPDGLADYLADFARRHAHLRVIHVPLDVLYHRNRGVGINRAFDASSGRVIISIDGDVVFPPYLIGRLRDEIEASPGCVFGVGRIFLPREVTESILSGHVDPIAKFHDLAWSNGDGEQNPHVGVLGYCQAVCRSAFARARYPEEFDRVNQSDIVFLERLGRWAGVQARFLESEAVLHLWHPRNWLGTNDFL